MKNNYYICPVCGKHRFTESGTFDICPQCGWENDEYYDAGGANEISLEEYKARYKSLINAKPDYNWKNDGFLDKEE